ncbi:unnamed protein product, partial [Oppiella nova]
MGLPNIRELDVSQNNIRYFADNSLNFVATNASKVIRLNRLKTPNQFISPIYNAKSWCHPYCPNSDIHLSDNCLPKHVGQPMAIHFESNVINSTNLETILMPFLSQSGHKMIFTETLFDCRCDDIWMRERPQSGAIFGVKCNDNNKRMYYRLIRNF